MEHKIGVFADGKKQQLIKRDHVCMSRGWDKVM